MGFNFVRTNWKNWKIAITGVGASASGPGTRLIRSLRANPEFRGQIVGLNFDAREPQVFSRAGCNSGYSIPHPSEGELILLDRLLLIHQKETIDLIIPCLGLDAEVHNFLLVRQKIIVSGMRLLVPSREQFCIEPGAHLDAFCKSGLSFLNLFAISDKLA